MSKKQFRRRKVSRPDDAEYPTLEEFDTGRRDFLARFGAAVLGAGVLGSVLSACGDRMVGEEPDLGTPPGGAPAPDAKIDSAPPVPPDGAAPMPDAKIDDPDGIMAGGAPMPDAKMDQQMHPGTAPLPDAKVDTVPEAPMGKRTPPDAMIDQQASPGFAPMPDAKVDPNPKP